MAQVGLLVFIASNTSPTIDEPAHLASGLFHWQTGTISSYTVNPPLVRLIATAPLVVAGRGVDLPSSLVHFGGRIEFSLGDRWLIARGSQATTDMWIARTACIVFALVGALSVFFWARDLYGRRAGLLALALWCFSPNVLAHGSLMTPDAASAAMGILACYAFQQWLRKPQWNLVMASGLCLGLALLTKSTWILLLGLFPVITLCWDLISPSSHTAAFRTRRIAKRVLQQLAIVVAGLFVLASGYGYERCFEELGSFEFHSSALAGFDTEGGQRSGNRFRGTWLEHAPIPLPASFLEGIDLQKIDFERDNRAYLGGVWKTGGWWYYYLYAVAVKVPLGTWGLGAIAVAVSFGRRGLGIRREEWVLLAPAVAVFGLASSQTGLNHHMRYVLPAFPFLFVFAGRIAQCVPWKSPHVRYSTMLLLSFAVVSSLAAVPHSLSYFNEAVGGPLRGGEHLVDSNIDWGQDLIHLRNWCDRHRNATPFFLAYWGPMEPGVLGIDYQVPPDGALVSSRIGSLSVEERLPKLGWYAVSLNAVRGHPLKPVRMTNIRGKSGGFPVPDDATYFQYLRPVDHAGYSIMIYHVTPRTLRELEAAMRGGSTARFPGGSLKERRDQITGDDQGLFVRDDADIRRFPVLQPPMGGKSQ